MNNFISNESSLVNLSRLLAVVINHHHKHVGKIEPHCQLVFDNGITISVSKKLAEEIIESSEIGWLAPDPSFA